MRSGIWSAAVAACALLGTWTASASAGGFHTIPRLTPALDYRTGEQYYAPPIPYGHYVGKQIPEHALGAVHGAAGLVHGPLGLVRGKLGGLFHGPGLFHGHGHGGCHADGSSDCGGVQWDGDSGFVGPAAGDAPDVGDALPYGGPSPIIQGQTFDAPAPMIQSQPTGQIAPMSVEIPGAPAAGPDRMIRDPALRGTGYGYGEASGQAFGVPAGGAYGPGLPIDGAAPFDGSSWDGGGSSWDGGGSSWEGGHCAGAGCSGHGRAGHGWGAGLLSWPHSLLGTVHGLPHTALGAVHGVVGTLLHHGDIDYFVGPGGPVPLTPGYVPYIVTTRSPRDFLSFPPFSDLDP
jgi:hypothetical protein